MNEKETRNLIPRPDVTTPILAWVTKLRGGKPVSDVWRKEWHVHAYVFPYVVRAFWCLFNRKMLRRYAFTFAFLATFLALAYAIEDWRGKRAWEKYKKEMEAKGAVYDWRKFIATNQHQLVKLETEEVKLAKKLLQLPPPGKLRFEIGPMRQVAGFWMETPPIDFGTWDKLPKHGTNEASIAKLMALGGQSVPIDLKRLQELSLRQTFIFLAEKSGLPLDAESTKSLNPDFYWLADVMMPRFTDMGSIELLAILLKAQGLQLVSSSVSGRFDLKDDISHETLLAWYELNQPVMEKFAAGFRDPDFRLNMDAVDPGRNGEPGTTMAHSSAMFLCIAAKLEIYREQPDRALMYMARIMDMTRAVSERGSASGAWVGPIGIHFYLEALNEGLRKKVFSPAHLRALRTDMVRVNLLANYRRFLKEDQRLKNTYAVEHYTRGELVDLYGRYVFPLKGGFRWFDFYLRVLPRGWMYRDLLRMDKSLERFLPAIDDDRRIVDSASLDLQNKEEQVRVKKQTRLNADLLFFAAPIGFVRSAQTMSLYQTKLHQAVIACALEEYLLEVGKYPAKLTDLVLKYLDEIPVDVIDGQPMRYLKETENSVRIYSVGWNRKDEGGSTDFSTYPVAARKQGWMYYSGYFSGVPSYASLDGDWVLFSGPTVVP